MHRRLGDDTGVEDSQRNTNDIRELLRFEPDRGTASLTEPSDSAP